ncbi:MAG: nickel pincer cofactor biosynthesis protein LarC, partial [Desulfobacterales bacterium]
MIVYFDCFSGISGDMTLGAFIDLGVPVDWLKETLSSLPLTGFELTITSIHRMGIQANQVAVTAEENIPSRNHADIIDLITQSPLSTTVKETSLKIFERIAVAEAGIHGRDVESVHFHEVGGIDAIVDIVGAALCVEYLEISRIVASRIPLGRGFTSCQHGILPVPSPATLAILKGVPTYGTEIEKEIVTPTGAAIVTTLADAFGPLPEMIIERIGYGGGQRVLEDRPNLLRMIAGTSPDPAESYRQDDIVIVETSIDDMNPEMFGFVMDRLFEDGALDVCWIPIYMKKNRPGTMIQVLCPKERRDAVIHRLLSETTTLGIRYHDAHRQMLARESRQIMTTYGKVQVKCITYP